MAKETARPDGRMLLLAAVSASAFAAIATNVALGRTRRFDERLRETVLQLQDGQADVASAIVTVITSPALSILLTCAAAALLARRQHSRRTWLPIAASPWLAMVAGSCFTAFLPQQYTPGVAQEQCEPCFPSGHTTGLTAEALTLAFVLRRRGLLHDAAFAGLLALPLIAGANRLYRDRHWASDIAGAWAAGTCVAALLASTV